MNTELPTVGATLTRADYFALVRRLKLTHGGKPSEIWAWADIVRTYRDGFTLIVDANNWPNGCGGDREYVVSFIGFGPCRSE